MALLAAALLAGCARAPVLPAHLGEGAAPLELTQVPFFAQERYQCGPAALATVLVDAGVDTDAETLVPQVYLPGREGSLQLELIAATRRHDRVPYRLEPTLDAVLAELQAGRPVLVMQNLGPRFMPVWHFAVVIGYRPDEDLLVLRSGTNRRHGAPAAAFLQTWERAERWAMVVLRPGQMPAAPDRRRYLQAVAGMEGIASPGALVDAWQAALERWPGDDIARFGLAAALDAAGKSGRAEAAYRDLVADAPDHAAALNNLALLLAARGCTGAARAALERALQGAAATGRVRAAVLETRAEIARATTTPATDPGCALPGS